MKQQEWLVSIIPGCEINYVRTVHISVKDCVFEEVYEKIWRDVRDSIFNIVMSKLIDWMV